MYGFLEVPTAEGTMHSLWTSALVEITIVSTFMMFLTLIQTRVESGFHFLVV